jgi:hypothetical protein
MLRFGRALSVEVVGLAAALIALILADGPLRAEPASRGEGRIAFTFSESGADRPAQLAVMDADGKNRRVLPASPSWPVVVARRSLETVLRSGRAMTHLVEGTATRAWRRTAGEAAGSGGLSARSLQASRRAAYGCAKRGRGVRR